MAFMLPIPVLETFSNKNLSLKNDVNTYLVGWKIPSNNYTRNTPVTMQQLLSHTAGIIGFRFKGYSQTSELPSLLDILNGKSPANTPSIVVVRRPGTKYEYSPAGYAIIQQVLVSIYHQSFATIMQKLILKPLNMTQSTFVAPLPDKYSKKIAAAYLPDGKPVPNGPYTFIAAAAGGLWTNSTDLSHFLIALEQADNGQTRGEITPTLAHKLMRPSINHNMGLGIDINLNKYGEELTTKGQYFGFSGFNTGYLSLIIGNKNGDGIVIMVNTAPYMTEKNIWLNF